ncbi:MAG: aminopeptidase P family protein [Anaerolineae bacterium]|nr:aminopeptidase P family protein [Anaerolineae bacterium]
MKSDLDALMQARNLDAILVSGKLLGNPPLIYVLQGARLTQALFIKKRGEIPQLIVGSMEREEALHAGYPVRLTGDFGYAELSRQHNGDPLATAVAYHLRVFSDLDIAGRLGFYGYHDQGSAYRFLSALAAATSDIEVVGEYDNDLILEARATKDAHEVARIQDVGERTIEVVRRTLRFLQGHRAGADEVLRKPGTDEPLLVGDVHAHICRLLAEQGLEDPEGFIFATGRDAGIPHSKGTPTAPLRLGESIVFDIFPREMGGGYFFDFTRTFSLGYAPEPLQALYRDVFDSLEHVKAALRAGVVAPTYQRMTCDFFQSRGYPTIAQDPATLCGYVHGLGHGVGLDIHEAPSFYASPSNTTVLRPGHVFTLEPGLYYPDRGMGCRLEDMIWIDTAGVVQTLTHFPYELVVPLE